ncbi:MAG: GNAT family N-acetyltransferase, partial [Solirubrobacterales bacterium]|nr:GNAT family N-acetyltransferase [Solirubrobacterales bacterium]
RYRPAVPADAGTLRAWRNHPATRAASMTTHEIAPGEHAAWLEAVIGDAQRELLVVQRDEQPIASVRFDRSGDEAEISIHVAPDRQAAGAGTQAIREMTELQLAARPQIKRIVATVSADNFRSRRAFEKAGYRPLDSPRPAWLRLQAVR